MHFLNLSGRFATTAKVGLCSVIALAALAGCNNSGTGDDSAANKTRITSTDGPAKRETKISGTKPNDNRKQNVASVAGTQTTTIDSVATQPTVLITGNVRFDDGATVTTGTVKAISYDRDDSGKMETRESGTVSIAADGTYQIQSAVGFSLNLFFEGEFPGTYEGLSQNELPNTPTLKKIKKDVTVQRGVEVRGRVVDDKDQPVNDALVQLRYTDPGRGNASEASTSSTATGEFVLPYVRRGKSKAMAFHKDLVTAPCRCRGPYYRASRNHPAHRRRNCHRPCLPPGNRPAPGRRYSFGYRQGYL